MAVLSSERDAISNANEPRLRTVAANILVRQLSALRIMIDASRDEATNFIIGEDKVMRFVDADAELLTRPLHKLNEVSVPKIHVAVANETDARLPPSFGHRR